MSSTASTIVAVAGYCEMRAFLQTLFDVGGRDDPDLEDLLNRYPTISFAPPEKSNVIDAKERFQPKDEDKDHNEPPPAAEG